MAAPRQLVINLLTISLTSVLAYSALHLKHGSGWRAPSSGRG